MEHQTIGGLDASFVNNNDGTYDIATGSLQQDDLNIRDSEPLLVNITLQDAAGNNARDAPILEVPPRLAPHIDTVPPRVDTALVISPTLIHISFDDTIIFNTPSPSDFDLSGAGSASITAVASVNDTAIALTLDSSNPLIDTHNSITVSYTQSTGSITDTLGNTVPGFGQAGEPSIPVTNTLDTTGPTFTYDSITPSSTQTAKIGDQIIITVFDSANGETGNTAVANATINSIPIDRLEEVATPPGTYRFISQPIEEGQGLPTNDGDLPVYLNLQDETGNFGASPIIGIPSDQRPDVDAVRPTLDSGLVTSPHSIRLVFSERMDASTITTSDFAVSAGSTSIRVSDVSVGTTTGVVTLTISQNTPLPVSPITGNDQSSSTTTTFPVRIVGTVNDAAGNELTPRTTIRASVALEPLFVATRITLGTIQLLFNGQVNASDVTTGNTDAWTVSTGTVTSWTAPIISPDSPAISILNITYSGDDTSTSSTPLVTYHNDTGITIQNIVGTPLTDGTNATATDGVAPILSETLISSSNANPQLAMPNDIITVQITASEPIVRPTVIIAGLLARDVVATGGSGSTTTTPSSLTWNASITVDDDNNGLPQGQVTFNITSFTDSVGNPGVPVHTDGGAHTPNR